jgi:hypothetical protein
MPVLIQRVVQHRAPELDPGVRFEAPLDLSSPNPDFHADSALSQQPAEHEGLLQTIRAQEEMPRSRLLKSRDRARRTKYNRIARIRTLRGLWHKLVERAFPGAISNHA